MVNVLGEWREGRAREAAESREREVLSQHVIVIIVIGQCHHCVFIEGQKPHPYLEDFFP